MVQLEGRTFVLTLWIDINHAAFDRDCLTTLDVDATAADRDFSPGPDQLQLHTRGDDCQYSGADFLQDASVSHLDKPRGVRGQHANADCSGNTDTGSLIGPYCDSSIGPHSLRLISTYGCPVSYTHLTLPTKRIV